LALAAIGAAGLVEWPVLLAIGGTALVVRQLNRHYDGETVRAPFDVGFFFHATRRPREIRREGVPDTTSQVNQVAASARQNLDAP
jgi:hypothetical protein